MEIERDDFFTKEEEKEEEKDQKKKFPLLTFLAARLVYYINVNFMYNLRKIQINPFSCLCYQYSGFPFQILLKIIVTFVRYLQNTMLRITKKILALDI